MTTTLLLTLLLLAIVGRSLALQRHASRHALLGTSGSAGWTVELRRRACVCTLPDDLQMFPQPREFRIRVWRLAGIPVWRRSAFVGLPLHCDALVDQLPAEAFNHLFDAAYRLPAAPGAGRASRTMQLTH
jgi:hypothetical protein